MNTQTITKPKHLAFAQSVQPMVAGFFAQLIGLA
jgi:hypothetical protein